MKKFYLLSILICYGYCSSAQTFARSANFFPIGVFAQAPYDIVTYKNAGVNLYVDLDWGALDAGQLASLHSGKMYVMCAQDSFALTKLSDTLIYGWTQGDEPDNAQWNAGTSSYDPCIAPSVIISNYNAMKAKDPTRPIYLNLGRGVSDINWVGRGTCTGNTSMYKISNNGYLKGCDIGCFDIYPVNNTDALTKNNLWYVPKGVDSLIVWSNNSKPIWAWIETTKIDNSSNRKPTPAEVKSEVWMAIIHGAKGYGYFCDSWIPSFTADAVLQDTAMMSGITAVNKQVTSLAAVINSASTSGYASVTSSNAAVPINLMTKNYGGYNYIFSVGMRPGKSKATYTVTSGTTVTVLGESRTIPISGGKFTDSIKTDYQVHIYKINAVTTSLNELSGSNSIRVFPNPVTESSTVEISSDKEETVRIEIIDVLGKTLSDKNAAVIQGINSFKLDDSYLTPGIYFVRISGDDLKGIVRFVKN